MMHVERTAIRLIADPERVLLRPFRPGAEERVRKIFRRVLALSSAAARAERRQLLERFGHRHRNLHEFWQQRYRSLKQFLPPGAEPDPDRQELIGAHFTMEYALEAAALFNPSMVWFPEERETAGDGRPFLLSLRATGEGHISSLVFQTGRAAADGRITLNKRARWVSPPVINATGDGYEATFSGETDLSERTLFPAVPEERNGIEDARFVAFRGPQGELTYYATYTAYDGQQIRSRLLETRDFRRFVSRTLRGAAVQNKNLALFPRKIGGHYFMLSRQDNENNYLMLSDDLYTWEKKRLLLEPRYPWEFVQLGNCGSPLETEAGWLVLGHAMGAMRQYVLSAFLLDLEDPAKVLGRLREPLLRPAETEREGYVPNVVYSCGSVLHAAQLIIPYAMSDSACSFASVDVKELLNELVTD